VELTLEIQTTVQRHFIRMHRSVNLLALPLPGDRIPLEFWKEGVHVRSRAFLLDGSVVLDLGWHGFDGESAVEQLLNDGWERIEDGA
jgi:hypothetical protein